MSKPPTLQELMQEWEAQQGATPPEVLCRDVPELLAPLLAHIRQRGSASTEPTRVETARAIHALPPSAPPGEASMPHTGLPGYQIMDQLGRGGIGEVYLARDVTLERVVALKMLRPWSLTDPELVERFRREAQAMAKLDHANIVPIFDHGELDGQPYFTMKYLPGGSLAEHRERFCAAPKQAVALMVKVARAVHYLHEQKLLHRDLKPLNILLSDKDEPFVSDFGLAKYLDLEVELTHAGELLGTHAYMAPEQTLGRVEEFGPATDVWALGVILYELLVGERPFHGANRESLLHKIATQEPPRPTSIEPKLPKPLETIIAKCLEKEPARRFASADELADELQRWLDDKPILTHPETLAKRLWRRVRRHPLVTAAVLLTVAVAVAGFLHWRAADPDRPLWEMQNELAQNQTVDFQDPTGRPRWHRWRCGNAGPPSVGPKGELVLETGKFSLLELLVDCPATSYRFSADVRHDENHQKASDGAGLYFDLDEHAGPQGPIFTFCSLTYNDLEVDNQRHNPVPMNVWLYTEAAEPRSISRRHNASTQKALSLRATGLEHGLGPWRSLQVVVTPERISAYVDGKPSNVALRTKLDAERKLPFLGKLDSKNKAFRGTGSLGLFLHNGAAAFKNIRLEPLKS